jgi:pimeloyl-ACP methyl ester carboxylesterase
MLSLFGMTATTYASGFSTCGGVRIHYRDTGDVPNQKDGPVLLLLHGFAGSTESWCDVVGPLAEQGCRSIAFDRVGFGLTERPAPPALPLPLSPRLPWEVSPFGDDPYGSRFAIERVLWPLVRARLGTAAAQRRPLFLVGHSLGCQVALRALVDSRARAGEWDRAPLRPRGAVLIAPACLDPREDLLGPPPESLADAVRQRLDLEARFRGFRLSLDATRPLAPLDELVLPRVREIAEGDPTERVTRGMAASTRTALGDARRDAIVAKYMAPLAQPGWDRGLLHFYRADRGIEPASGRALLSAAADAACDLGVRVRVVSGDVDAVVPIDAARKVASTLGAPAPSFLTDTGHLPMDERPEALARAIAQFVQEP